MLLASKMVFFAGSLCTHTICVTVIHQNVCLLVSTLKLHHKKAIHQLMYKIVYNRDNKASMMCCCINCPNNNESLKNYLNVYFKNLKDYDNDREIQFLEWINDGQMKLQIMTLPIEEFRVGKRKNSSFYTSFLHI